MCVCVNDLVEIRFIGILTCFLLSRGVIISQKVFVCQLQLIFEHFVIYSTLQLPGNLSVYPPKSSKQPRHSPTINNISHSKIKIL